RLGVARILRTACYPGKRFLNFFQKKFQIFQRPSAAGHFPGSQIAAGPLTGLASEHRSENNARLMH
ncbi:hypothetical protein, partial [Pseudomonas oryzicola]